MRSEEILRREAEYRAIHEALGACNLALVLAGPCSQALPEASVPTWTPGPAGTPSSRTPLSQLPDGGEILASKGNWQPTGG
jgi:hypothetical protein